MRARHLDGGRRLRSYISVELPYLAVAGHFVQVYA